MPFIVIFNLRFLNCSFFPHACRYLDRLRPVVVRNEMKNWSALNYFGLNYFGQLYASTSARNHHRRNCQFFRYRTKFRSLDEALQRLLHKQRPNKDKTERKYARANQPAIGQPVFDSTHCNSINQTAHQKTDFQDQCHHERSPWYIGWYALACLTTLLPYRTH